MNKKNIISLYWVFLPCKAKYEMRGNEVWRIAGTARARPSIPYIINGYFKHLLSPYIINKG
ncbi:MAG: hypothetical protein WC523_04715 [Patescibacteria group bacterium]